MSPPGPDTASRNSLLESAACGTTDSVAHRYVTKVCNAATPPAGDETKLYWHKLNDATTQRAAYGHLNRRAERHGVAVWHTAG